MPMFRAFLSITVAIAPFSQRLRDQRDRDDTLRREAAGRHAIVGTHPFSPLLGSFTHRTLVSIEPNCGRGDVPGGIVGFLRDRQLPGSATGSLVRVVLLGQMLPNILHSDTKICLPASFLRRGTGTRTTT